MPAKSQAQRAWAYGKKGKKWAEAHHFDNPGKLPARVKTSKPHSITPEQRKMIARSM